MTMSMSKTTVDQGSFNRRMHSLRCMSQQSPTDRQNHHVEVRAPAKPSAVAVRCQNSRNEDCWDNQTGDPAAPELARRNTLPGAMQTLFHGVNRTIDQKQN